MGFMVYWMQSESITDEPAPCAKHFSTTDMSKALAFMEELRKTECIQFVTMASQTIGLVGKSGATGVADGKLPTGEEYTYTKRDALSQRTTIRVPPVGTDFIEVNLDE